MEKEIYDTRKEEQKQKSGKEQEGAAAVLLDELPEGCIGKIVSLTTPADACRVSCVSTTVRSAAASDYVWYNFLPIDYQAILSRSADPDFSSLSFSSKKQLFSYLSDNPILIDEGKKDGAYGFDYHPTEVSLVLGDDEICSKSVVLNPMNEGMPRHFWHWDEPDYIVTNYSTLSRPKERADGWLEIEIGDFFNRYGDDEMEMKVMEVKAGAPKSGFILQGIEIRPKAG
ncbi:Phloem protein 2-like protein [Corchorus capsularis]|uniref:Phloem protein 2-like protein n=1 Tax=Corchorus capsularis TaxID=210143 RepID=A0A1R3GNY5_COCAP|nr:Phloem protein 2-like protein [Corchorus capsularis]